MLLYAAVVSRTCWRRLAFWFFAVILRNHVGSRPVAAFVFMWLCFLRVVFALVYSVQAADSPNPSDRHPDYHYRK
ncbi:hypothetical protein Y032_0024g1018 [Ancylostoma ceylanicum]|uniref:Uncharacterized protein n=1 Tax=Ancylostoma ceylanicum TaxID=53326 RepID=A0A016UV59_9BILA|nr:hypothetical protein Y032_0024g1018 [Ancylostoma ceylanicum]